MFSLFWRPAAVQSVGPAVAGDEKLCKKKDSASKDYVGQIQTLDQSTPQYEELLPHVLGRLEESFESTTNGHSAELPSATQAIVCMCSVWLDHVGHTMILVEPFRLVVGHP